MNTGIPADAARIAAMLQQLRSANLAELPERCGQIERLVLDFSVSGGRRWPMRISTAVSTVSKAAPAHTACRS